MRIIGLVVQANTNARIGKAANPTSSSGRRPHVFARRPAHEAMIATITWGTMINAETMSEEKAEASRTSAEWKAITPLREKAAKTRSYIVEGL